MATPGGTWPPDPPGLPPFLASIRCSFCGKRAADVDKVIAGPTPAVAICNECVELCADIIAEERAGDGPPDTADVEGLRVRSARCGEASGPLRRMVFG